MRSSSGLGRTVVGKLDRSLLVNDPETRVLFVLPDPDAVGDPELASALALRNRATLEGKCPRCGATEQPAGKAPAFVTEHESDCPAGNDRVLDLIQKAGL